MTPRKPRRAAAARWAIAAPRSRWRRCTWRGSAPRWRRVARAAAGPRRRAREVAFRIAFQADLNGDSFADTWASRRAEEHLTHGPSELVQDVVGALTGRGDEIDGLLRTATEHWPLERLSATDRAVLRAAVAELVSRQGTPA